MLTFALVFLVLERSHPSDSVWRTVLTTASPIKSLLIDIIALLKKAAQLSVSLLDKPQNIPNLSYIIGIILETATEFSVSFSTLSTHTSISSLLVFFRCGLRWHTQHSLHLGVFLLFGCQV